MTTLNDFIPDVAANPPEISAECVLEQLRAFPRGTAAGSAGLRVQHLLDALVPGEEEALGVRLAALVNWFARGQAPRAAAEDVAGARLVALLKPNGKLRPIAIGEVLRRLVAKCLCASAGPAARRLLWPLQTGVAIPLGLECSVRVVRQLASRQRLAPGDVLLQIDARNAFNNIKRRFVLQEVRDHFPGLLPWLLWCYDNEPKLRFGQLDPLRSAEG
eukprot:gene5110-biopygen6244